MGTSMSSCGVPAWWWAGIAHLKATRDEDISVTAGRAIGASVAAALAASFAPTGDVVNAADLGEGQDGLPFTHPAHTRL
jgi:hypothetical protein